VSPMRLDLVKSDWGCQEFVTSLSTVVQHAGFKDVGAERGRFGEISKRTSTRKSGMLSVFISVGEISGENGDSIVSRRQADDSGQLLCR